MIVTTPERLRRRQLRNDWFVVGIAVALVFGWLITDRRDAKQGECIAAFVSTYTDTAAVRSQAVEDESQATRVAIRSGLSAKSRQEAAATLIAYDRALSMVDRKRKENPARTLPEGICE